VTVKGILAFWKAAPFAGRRRNEGLGRSVVPQRVPPAEVGAPMTADVRRLLRRGTSSRMRTERMHPTQAREIVACARQTRPSLGPPTRARRSSLHTGRQKRLRGGATVPASRLGKSTQVGGTNTGVGRTDAARLAACHRFRKGEGVTRRRQGWRSRPSSLRGSGVPVGFARTSCFSCRSLQATSGLE